MAEEQKINVLLIGHSLMVGIGGRNGEIFRRSAAGMPLKIDISAKEGSSISWSLQQLKAKGPSKYDAIVIFTGGNDLERDARDVAKDLKSIYDAARKGGAKVFIFSIPPTMRKPEIEAKKAMLNLALRLFAKDDLIDIGEAASRDPNQTLRRATKDWTKIHPTPEGYKWLRELLRTRIAEWIGSGIKKRSQEKVIMADKKPGILTDPIEDARAVIGFFKEYFQNGSPGARASAEKIYKKWVIEKAGSEDQKKFASEFYKNRDSDAQINTLWQSSLKARRATRLTFPEFLADIKKNRSKSWPIPLTIREIPKLLDAVLPAPKKLKDGGFVLLTPGDPAITRLAQNKEAFERLYLSVQRNRENFTTELFKRFIGMIATKKVLEEDKERPFDFDIISVKWPKLFQGGQASFGELAGAERLGSLRVVLFDYISAGNKKFNEEVQGFEIFKKTQEAIEAAKQLNDSKWVKEYPKEAEKAKTTIASFFAIPLGVEDILATALYLRRLQAEAKTPGEGAKLGSLDLKLGLPGVPVKVTMKEQEKKTKEPPPLERKYLVGCSMKLSGFVMQGNPTGLIKFQQEVQKGFDTERSLEGMLFALGHDKELLDALISVFKTMAQKNSEFKSFLVLRGRSDLAKPDTDFSEKPSAKAAIQMLQMFLNFASGYGEEAKILNQDFRVMNRHLGSPGIMKVTGDPSMQTLALLAVYSWRMKEENKKVVAGGWDAALKKPASQPEGSLLDAAKKLKQ